MGPKDLKAICGKVVIDSLARDSCYKGKPGILREAIIENAKEYGLDPKLELERVGLDRRENRACSDETPDRRSSFDPGEDPSELIKSYLSK